MAQTQRTILSTPLLPLNKILLGDCVQHLQSLPDQSVDLIFADPPYNMQLGGDLTRPDQSSVDGVDDAWDQFSSMAAYDDFCRLWLQECRRVLTDTGTIWVIGSYHNISRIGTLLMDLDYWILNDVIWHKTNPMPNFKGTRFQNATETLLWAQKSKGKKYTFHYQLLKNFNDDKQMSNVWDIPLCTGGERLKNDAGEKVHTTQKPEALLYRVIASSSNVGDVVLDPFFGTGTTGAVAKKLGRHFIGIERDAGYTAAAQQRIDAIAPVLIHDIAFAVPSRRTAPKVGFVQLIEQGLLPVGAVLCDKKQRFQAVVRVDGQLVSGDKSGSIHSLGAALQNLPACNGWDFWYWQRGADDLVLIDELRAEYRKQYL